MSDQPPIMPGSVLVSCTLSCVVGGVVQTNIGDRERMWRVDDPDKLRDQLGRGLLARTPSGPGRYRESGLIDEKQGLLILPARFPDQDGRVGAVDIVTLTPLNGHAVAAVDQAKVEIAMAVRHTIPVMLQDGGAIVLEPTEPETGGSRWVRVFRRESQLAVWTSPQPDSEMWRPAFVGDTEARAVMPLGDSAIHDAAVLAADAFAAWECSPWDVSLTFEPYQEKHETASPMPEERGSRRGLFGRRRRQGRGKVETPPRPAANGVSQARSSIAAVQGHMRVEPLGGAHWTEARIGLGPWAGRILLDSEAGEFRCEAQIPGVTDTSGVDEAAGAAPFEPPSATYSLSPGPTVVTLSYSRPLAAVDPAVVRETALKLVTATSAAAYRLWDVLSPMELARLAQLGISTPDGLYSTPDQMLMAKPIAHVEWDQRVAPVDSAPPAEAELPQGVAGVIPGPIGPEWASTIAEIREVLDHFTSTMNIEVQRRDRDDEIYIQLSHEGDHFFAEAVSNTFLEGASRLNSTEMQRLSHLGWHPPAGEDDPNWSRSYGEGNTGDVAQHLARTLRDAYGTDPEADGWLIKWSDPASEPADPARVIPIAPPAKTPPRAKKTAPRPNQVKKAASRQQNPEPAASLAPEISNALQHLRNSLGTAFQTRERPTGGFDLVTTNGHTYGVAQGDFIASPSTPPPCCATAGAGAPSQSARRPATRNGPSEPTSSIWTAATSDGSLAWSKAQSAGQSSMHHSGARRQAARRSPARSPRR